jgi:uncharacterized protein YjdB
MKQTLLFVMALLMAMSFGYGQKKIAYITKYKTGMAAGIDIVKSDAVLRFFNADANLSVTTCYVTDITAAATFDFSPYDAVVIQESFGGGDAILFPNNALGFNKIVKPCLYNKTYALKTGRGLTAAGSAQGTEKPGVLAITVPSAKQNNDLFKGLTFTGDSVVMFNAGSTDLGAAGTKALNYGKFVLLSSSNTLLADALPHLAAVDSQIVCINDIPAGTLIGGVSTDATKKKDTIRARTITMGMNFGAICYNNGKNITDANITIWRNAIYSLSGLSVPSTPVTRLTSVEVTSSATSISTLKGTLQLGTTVLPSNATFTGVYWSTSDSALATVDANGLVTAVGNGTVTITATAKDGYTSGTISITITGQPTQVSSISVWGENSATTITTDNGTLQLFKKTLPIDAADTSVTWISSDITKATVSSTGLVTAVSDGSVTITAKANDPSRIKGSITLAISNQVVPVSSVTVKSAGNATTVNTTLQLTATVAPTYASVQTVTWTSSDDTKATVSSTGLVTAVKSGGPVTITAKATDGSNVEGTFSLTINIKVSAISVWGTDNATTISTDNGTLQLLKKTTPANALDTTVTWSSSDATIATVSSTGLITAILDGNVTITATANDGSGIKGSISLTITGQKTPVSSINVWGEGNASTISTDNGTLQLHTKVLPTIASDSTLTWSSSDNTKATVSSTGLVTAVDNGTVTITATANDGSAVTGTLSVTITNQVTPVSAITVTGAGNATAISTKGGTLQLTANVEPTNATDKTVTWSTSNAAVATVSTSGLVTAVTNGSATITATANDGSGIKGTLAITITGQEVKVTSISLSAASTTITTSNGTVQINANVDPSDATDTTLTWTSSDATKATVSNTGLVTAVANGTATITATANDGSEVAGSIVITVNIAQVGVDVAKADKLIFGPNPASNYITIQNAQIKDIEVLNSNGAMVLTSKLATIDVSNLSSGMYIIRVYTNDQTLISTFIKK